MDDYTRSREWTPLTEQEYRAIKDRKTQATARITTLDEELLRATDILVALYQERKAVKEERQILDSLNAPIRSLPPDVLREIFILCGLKIVVHLPMKRFNSFLRDDGSEYTRFRVYSRASVRFTSVCTHWRHLILGSPMLWTTLRVEHERKEDRINDACPVRAIGTLKRFLSLSMNSPLDVYTDFCPFDLSENKLNNPSYHIMETADRWKQATLRICTSALSPQEDFNIGLPHLPLLNYLALERCYTYVGKSPFTPVSISAPVLRHVAFHDVCPDNFRLLPWKQLTNVDLTSHTSIVKLISHNINYILQNATSLVRLYLDEETCPNPADLTAAVTFQNPTTVTSLHLLSSRSAMLLSATAFPNLSTLTIGDVRNIWGQEISTCPTAIFVSNLSQRIDTLTLKFDNWKTEEQKHLLHLLHVGPGKYMSEIEEVAFFVKNKSFGLRVVLPGERASRAKKALREFIRLIEEALLLNNGTFSAIDDRKLQTVQFAICGLDVIPESSVVRLGALRAAGLDVRVENGNDGHVLFRLSK